MPYYPPFQYWDDTMVKTIKRGLCLLLPMLLLQGCLVVSAVDLAATNVSSG
ncbi:MAG: hypothetical protein Q4E77_05445 [Conchiformibius sp.]|nr:hypothetical protein [Conchiformibius sp.]